MMSLATLRSKDHYKAIVRELRHAGLSWREEFRGKHAALVISVNGREETEILSSTPSDHRAPIKARANIRRRIKQWKAEAASTLASAVAPAELPTLENETMQRSTAAEEESIDDLIEVRDGVAVVSSKEVASRFSKENKHVNEAIKRLVAQAPELQPNFRPFKINDLSGSGISHYEMDRDGFSLLAMGFTGSKALAWKIKFVAAFNAMEQQLRRHLTSHAELDRAVGMLKSLVRDMAQHRRITDEQGRAIQAIEEALTDPASAPLVPAFNFAGSVTALEIITLAGVKPDQRVRGTSAAVTLRMKDFCLSHGYTALQTPVAIDASSRWRFPREAAQQWLYGEHHGAEFIHTHIRARKGDSTPDMFAVIKGGKR